MGPEPVYVISVVSRILQMHPQTLRKYERAGLVRPFRSEGRLRLYSDDDVRRLRLIKHLIENVGLNLAGVELILRIHGGLERLQAMLAASNLNTPTIGSEIDELFGALEREVEQ